MKESSNEAIELEFELAQIRHQLKLERFDATINHASFSFRIPQVPSVLVRGEWTKVVSQEHGKPPLPISVSLRLGEFDNVQYVDATEIARTARRCLLRHLRSRLAEVAFEGGFVRSHAHVNLMVDDTGGTYTERITTCVDINYPLPLDRTVDLIVGAVRTLQKELVLDGSGSA